MGLHAQYRALVGAGLLAATLPAAQPAAGCEIALALAVDVSGSVDPDEYRLQMDGLAAALRDPTVSEALATSEAILTVIQWSGSSRQAVTIPWRQIRSIEDAEALAADIAADERRWWLFSTAIGEALRLTAGLFDQVPQCRRRVIDVSGDGRSNEGEYPERLHALMAARNITVNGLAIEGSEPGMTRYYREHVITGPGAFVMTAETFADYPERIRRKLLTEVTAPVTEAEPPEARPRGG